MGRKGAVVFALLLGLLPVQSYALTPATDILRWGGCWFDNPDPGRIDCAVLQRRVAKAGGGRLTVELPVVRIRYDYARARSIHGDVSRPSAVPIVYVNGGPGMATGLDRAGVRDWLSWYDNQGWPHDLVLYDQRGTGFARPRLDCPDFRAAAPEILAQHLSLKEEVRQWEVLNTRCRDQLLADGIDPGAYSTDANADDLWSLVRGLGGEVNLLAQSYGAKIALRLLARGASGVRALVLDSPYPPGVDRTLSSPYVVQRAVEALAAACTRDEQCRQDIGDAAVLVQGLAEKLRAEPMQVRLASTAGHIEVVINDSRFLDILFMAMGQGDPARGLLPVLKQLQLGQDAPFLAWVGMYLDWMLDEQFSDPVFQLVECHDQPGPISEARYRRSLDEYPMLGRLVSDPWLWDKPACPIWGYGGSGAQDMAPVSYEIPALVLSGELDAITPPGWAHLAKGQFRVGHHVTVPDAGHGVLGGDLCLIWLIRSFWSDPAQAPDASCWR